jgi:hypothetical protein
MAAPPLPVGDVPNSREPERPSHPASALAITKMRTAATTFGRYENTSARKSISA